VSMGRRDGKERANSLIEEEGFPVKEESFPVKEGWRPSNVTDITPVNTAIRFAISTLSSISPLELELEKLELEQLELEELEAVEVEVEVLDEDVKDETDLLSSRSASHKPKLF
jgi:hypothetical protein